MISGQKMLWAVAENFMGKKFCWEDFENVVCLYTRLLRFDVQLLVLKNKW